MQPYIQSFCIVSKPPTCLYNLQEVADAESSVPRNFPISLFLSFSLDDFSFSFCLLTEVVGSGSTYVVSKLLLSPLAAYLGSKQKLITITRHVDCRLRQNWRITIPRIHSFATRKILSSSQPSFIFHFCIPF